MDVKIILCMIVRNESKIIRRCLDSARSVLDGISICDTGSTDNTVDIIKQSIQEYGIPGVVHQHVWKNFAHNRSLSFDAAREFAIQNKFNLAHTYALFLDADMMLVVEPEFKKSSLTAKGYNLIQRSGSLSYPNVRLGRLDLNWKSVSVTHEYWTIIDKDGKQHSEVTTFDDLWINDRNDGGCKADKFIRDIRLLTEGLVEEPNNSRYHFYLARSYEDSGQLEKAIEWYEKRIKMDGYWEEIWYSRYCMGRCYQKIHDRYSVFIERRKKRISQLEEEAKKKKKKKQEKLKSAPKDGPCGEEEDRQGEVSTEESELSESEDDARTATVLDIEKETSIAKLNRDNANDQIKREEAWRMALEKYLDAHNQYSGRAEPFYHIANHYRYTGQYELSYFYAKAGYDIPYPREASLFLEDQIYNYLLLFELCISGYFTRFRDEAFSYCEEMILDSDIPNGYRDQIHREMIYYIPKLSTNWNLAVDIDRPLVENPIKPGDRYVGMNPSIIQEDHGYTMIYRTVNFLYDSQQGTYDSMDQDGFIRTRNYLVKLNQLLKVISCVEIVENKVKERHPTRVLGMEDCRLFKKDSRYYFSCTTRYTNPNDQPQITLCRLSRQPNAEGKLEVDMFLPLIYKDVNHCEKNWLPWVDGNEIKFIYGHHPLRIVVPNMKTGLCTDELDVKNSIDLHRFRGSAGPIPFDLPLPVDKKEKKKPASEPGYLTIVHEVIFRYRGKEKVPTRRHYVHRFVWMDKSFTIRKISRPFCFEKADTEFVCGMCYEHNRSNGSILMSMGLGDKQAKVYSIEAARIYPLLRNIRTE